MREAFAALEREARHAGEIGPALEGPHELAKRQLALAAHDEVDARARIRVGVGRQARIVAADHYARGGPETPDQLDDPERGVPLEGHDREADEVRLDLAYQTLERLADPALDEDQIGDGHPMVRIDVPGQ